MERRGFLKFLGIGGAAAAATAFVPFVIPASTRAADIGKTVLSPAIAPLPQPTKGKKVWIFGSIYSMLRIQISPKQAIQFLNGRYWTEDQKVAEAVTLALSKSVAGVHHGGGLRGPGSIGYPDGSTIDGGSSGKVKGFESNRPGTCGWEIKTKEDLERLQLAAEFVRWGER